ncbi:hypothetical protein SDC9_182791 [bioreactor metagenome]|uniref:DUF3850 domain-containing protein n=1 Tax=bioreactor metagenome TaxID=1076179 RepID=A0A645HGP5_9ZZZZ
MKIKHKLKTLPKYFDKIVSGSKTFEVRRDDRPFTEGDSLSKTTFQKCFISHGKAVDIRQSGF